MTKRSTLAATLPLTFLMALPALADRLSADWQAQRDFYNEITLRACDGDRAALEMLEADALDGMEAVAMNNLAWLHLEVEGCPALPMERDAALARVLYRDSANMLYPVAMYNHGRLVFYGRDGASQRQGDGLSWLESAAMEGLAISAEALALIYAEGREGVSADLRAADHYYALAERNGLPSARLARLATTLDAAAEAGASAPVAQAGQAPTARQGGGGGGGAVGFFEVLMSSHTNLGGIPELGGRVSQGNWVDEVVYIAQGYGNRRSGCWEPTGVFLVGEARVEMTEYAPDTLQSLVDYSAQERQAGRNSRYVTNFTTLNDGVSFVERNQSLTSENGQPFHWTLADARASGPACSNPVFEVIYPAPVRAVGY